jgi:hypothetical protein
LPTDIFGSHAYAVDTVRDPAFVVLSRRFLFLRPCPECVNGHD